MARNRLAKILKGMAARKELKTAHYKIYLCLLAAAQDGSGYNMNVLSMETGLGIRTIQRAVKEMLDSGNISQSKDGWLQLAFDPGIGRDRFDASGADSGPNGSTEAKSLSMHLRSYILYYISPNQISNIRSVKRNTNDITLKILDLPKVDLMSPDMRFKKVVDGIFEIYETETGKTLNVLFKASDGAMVKRMLTKLPEESVSRILESFKRFVTTTNGFDADQLHQAPVRYWATRVTKWLPKKELDFNKVRAKIAEKED